MATWDLMIKLETPINMTCAQATSIPKGTLVKLADLMTVAASDGDRDLIAGVTAEEKIGGDGKTEVAVYRRGIFRVTCGGNCTVGKSLSSYSSTGDANDVIDGTNASIYGINCCQALETGIDGETIMVELMPGGAGTNQLA